MFWFWFWKAIIHAALHWLLLLRTCRFIDMAEKLCQKRALAAFRLDPEKWGGWSFLCYFFFCPTSTFSNFSWSLSSHYQHVMLTFNYLFNSQWMCSPCLDLQPISRFIQPSWSHMIALWLWIFLTVVIYLMDTRWNFWHAPIYSLVVSRKLYRSGPCVP